MYKQDPCDGNSLLKGSCLTENEERLIRIEYPLKDWNTLTG